MVFLHILNVFSLDWFYVTLFIYIIVYFVVFNNSMYDHEMNEVYVVYSLG